MIDVLLCDADGNLFPSEEPAFEASAEVTNALLAELGVERTYAPDELRRVAMGRSFRDTASRLAAEHGAGLDAPTLERYVDEERRAVTAHLGRVLAPDPRVLEPLRRLATAHRLAVVSSSALERLAACFAATGLDELFPPEVRFSAQDSLIAPTSKPDPAIYALAGSRLGVSASRALAVEDAVAGVRSAVAAGFPVVGNLLFVAPEERDERTDALLDAGAVTMVASWAQLEELLAGRGNAADRALRRACAPVSDAAPTG